MAKHRRMAAAWMITGMLGVFVGISGGSAEAAIKAMVNEPKDVVLSISDAYVPSGFDSGSDAYVVVNGFFPNTCYQWKHAAVHRSAPLVHEIRSVGKVRQGMCLMMLVPFTQEVRLGRLERGAHVLRFVNGDGTWIEKRMNIE